MRVRWEPELVGLSLRILTWLLWNSQWPLASSSWNDQDEEPKTAQKALSTTNEGEDTRGHVRATVSQVS